MSPSTLSLSAINKLLFDRVYQSFTRSGMLQQIGTKLIKVESGMVEIILPHSNSVGNQHGGFHGGAIGTLADIAGGYAGLTVAPEGMEVTTVEYKINFVAAYNSGHLKAVGKVVRPGKRIIVATTEIFHVDKDTGKESICAVSQHTLAPVKMIY